MSKIDLFDSWEDSEVPDENAVDERLRQLGLTSAMLREAIRDGQAAGDFCTTAHPVFYPGCRVYGETNGSLRLRLATEGWTFNDSDNIPRAVSPDGSVVITAIQGDANTGLRHGRQVQTRRPRKTASLRIIKRNLQFLIEAVLPEDDPELSDEMAGLGELGPTWFLLYYRDGDTVRCEVSLAAGVSDTGRLLTWSERLILPEIDLLDGNSPSRSDSEPPPEVDVPVTRRTG